MKITNILVFVGAFIFVTAGLIFLNTMFKNIFEFDFTPVSENTIVQDSSIVKKKNNAEKFNHKEIVADDTIKSIDSLTVLNNQEVIMPSKKSPQPESIKQDVPALSDNYQPEKQNEELVSEFKNRVKGNNQTDSSYTKWLKNTAQMFEAMEPKKAAKIIINYTDENARDIMYKMKKKKAAEILAELDPLSANRITRYWEENRE